jgi:hypothetical protein
MYVGNAVTYMYVISIDSICLTTYGLNTTSLAVFCFVVCDYFIHGYITRKGFYVIL